MSTPAASGSGSRVFVLVLLSALAPGLITLVAPGAFSQGGSVSEAPGPAPDSDPPAGSITSAPEGAPPVAAGGFDFAVHREDVFKAFYQTGLDTSKAYTVANLAIRKENMTLLLKQGTVFLMQPIGGEVTGAAFLGEGEASMTPPSRTQRFMLKKQYGSESLKEPFTEAVFRFSDGTDKTLIGPGNPAPVSNAARAMEIFKDRNGVMDATRWLQLETQFLVNRIADLQNRDYFLADFHSAKYDWLLYQRNPAYAHENFLAKTETMGAKGRRYYVTWAQWHKQSDYDPTGHCVVVPGRDGMPLVDIEHHDMTLNLPTLREVEWDITLRLRLLVGGLRAIDLDLDNNADFQSRWWEELRPVTVLSVTDEAGRPLITMHKKDRLLILLSSPGRAGSTLTISARGKAEVIYQLTAESFGLLQNDWYPRYGHWGGRGSFHWTVRVPKSFLITGSGKILREFEENGQSVIETRCELPVEFPWVIFGRFQKAASTYVGAESGKTVPMTIHSFPNMTFTITDTDLLGRLGRAGPVVVDLSAPTDKVKGFMNEGKEILKLYEKIYGPYPYDELHIAQMAPQLGFGQAPQGFVQLTGAAFLSQARLESDFVHGFLAHEFAHQWWGHQVNGATGDDEWLSESFAEYASGIFVNEYQGAKRFQQTLQDWKKSAVISDPEGPIAAANIQSGPVGGMHRTYLLYNKGPYVLHMLRVQLDDEMYSKVMRSVQETYRNQNISTEMLLREVNRVTGSDYTYFFDQWFWDVGIPRFRYSWRSEKQPDGRFLIIVHVGQEDRNRIKRVLMPVHIHFKDKTIPQYKPVTQAEQDIKLLSPDEPKDVTLDDDHTLLADIVKAG